VPDGKRPNSRYDPVREAAERWSAWTFEEKQINDGSERFLPDEQVVIIDIDKFGGDRDLAWAHVIVHLENGDYDTQSGWLTNEQEDLVDWVVTVRLDREEDRPWSTQS
jgi:hypothetical protein